MNRWFLVPIVGVLAWALRMRYREIKQLWEQRRASVV